MEDYKEGKKAVYIIFGCGKAGKHAEALFKSREDLVQLHTVQNEKIKKSIDDFNKAAKKLADSYERTTLEIKSFKEMAAISLKPEPKKDFGTFRKSKTDLNNSMKKIRATTNRKKSKRKKH